MFFLKFRNQSQERMNSKKIDPKFRGGRFHSEVKQAMTGACAVIIFSIFIHLA